MDFKTATLNPVIKEDRLALDRKEKGLGCCNLVTKKVLASR